MIALGFDVTLNTLDYTAWCPFLVQLVDAPILAGILCILTIIAI